MIIGYLNDEETYGKMIPHLQEICRIVNESEGKPCGRYETDWGFYMIQEGETSPAVEGLFESHRKYADVQCLVKGCEYLEWQDCEKLLPEVPYSEEKDAQFWKGQGTQIEIHPGMFYVMYPRDGHKACCHVKEQTSYRKVVVKVKL